jgi:membrane peptidoglycan carboxypeptidase
MKEGMRRRSIFSFRRVLIRVHQDLLDIDRFVTRESDCYPDRLTELERFVIVLEDRRFFSHGGVHWKAVLREILRGLTFRRMRGASTIDMQFVRRATGNYRRSLGRKIYEMTLASIIQYRYSKLVILRSYLDIAYLGWDLRGMDSVAHKEFGAFADNMSGLDAAKLASYLVFPKPKYPTPIWERRVLRRANYIYSKYISREKSFDKIERAIFS